MREPWEEVQHPQRAKQDFLHYLREDIFQLNFYRLHMLYFILVIAICSVIVYGQGLASNSSEVNGTVLRYIDALFLCCSAMTTTGLSTANLGGITYFQQAVLCMLLVIGNVVFVSVFVVIIRRHYFRQRLADVVQHSKSGRKILKDIERQESGQASSSKNRSGKKGRADGQTSSRQADDEMREGLISTPADSRNAPRNYRKYHHQNGFGSFPAPWEMKSVRKALHFPFRKLSTQGRGDHSYLSFEVNLDEKGRIKTLNEHERAELGGIEYRALDVLLAILAAYNIFWVALGAAFLVPYSYRASVVDVLHSSQPGNLNPGWFGFFSTVTSFANGGLNVFNPNFVPFRSYYGMLTVCGLLTVAGNTQFPVFLRLLIWALSKISPQKSELRQTLQFLLHHPRRCFIYLFPSKETWYLFAVQLMIDFTEWILFEVLNLGVPAVMEIPPNVRAFDGLFQSTGLRTSGAYIINLSYLAPALLVAYVVIMYISSFPIVMTLRQTNTYEERSIGLDKGGSGGGLGLHLRRQLAYDLWFQLLAWFLICIIERDKLMTEQPGFKVFNILFEVASAYGTVGLSLGVPYDSYSLSGAFQTGSKLVTIAVMIRGRHRGLPLAIDRSILLPGQDLMRKMDREYNEYGEVDPSDEAALRRDEELSGKRDHAGGGGAEQDPEGSEDDKNSEEGEGEGHSTEEGSGQDPKGKSRAEIELS